MIQWLVMFQWRLMYQFWNLKVVAVVCYETEEALVMNEFPTFLDILCHILSFSFTGSKTWYHHHDTLLISVKYFIFLAVIHMFLTNMTPFDTNLHTIPMWLIPFWFDSTCKLENKKHNIVASIIDHWQWWIFMARIQLTVKTRLY